ncbi:electron transport complex subunit RsxG [Candidatus Thiosymbion oneisti]|uniref:electron transport complex subunit RsxG n=1 Tax=Candidatus Thiosymbion oneisti TaxID=589554 RepID=UPI000AA3CB77|nr:electron transport complex subunit RsxG [Candidatus Thiosymbion oneisti]
MSTLAAPSAPKPLAYQASLLGVAAMLAAVLLVIGNLATRDAIEQRRAEDLLTSLGQVIPAGMHDNDLLAHPLTLTRATGEEVTVYRARRGRLVTGVAFRVSRSGYAGPIELILGLDTQGEILGVRVLAHAETPGLGDKIEVQRDDWILGFNGRSLGNPPAERWAVKKDGGDFDQFSGATITPRAVVGAVKDGLRFFRDHRPTLLAGRIMSDE